MMRSLYDVVRIVDPMECCEVEFDGNEAHYVRSCYNCWQIDHRCVNCTSYRASLTGVKQEKTELFHGNVYHIQANPLKVMMPNGRLDSYVLELISAHPASEDELHQRVEKQIYESGMSLQLDNLTGLYSWDGFTQAVRNELQKDPKNKALIVADIVQYDLIRSLFGDEKLEQLLVQIANDAEKFSSRVLAAGRMKEGRFLMLCSLEDIPMELFERGVASSSDILLESAFQVRIRNGIYKITDPSLSIMEMYDRACMALDTVRNNPVRPVAFFTDEMERELKEHQNSVVSFESALKNGSYHIFLQGQVDGNGRLEGAEALVRKIDTDGTITDPGIFLSSLEDAGLIAQLDRYVWERAMAVLASWKHTKQKDLYISVNVAAQDLYYCDVCAILTLLSDKYQINRSKFYIEIQEEAFLNDEHRSIETIKKIKAAGFKIIIDDFGKGVSSLRVLRDVPADAIKLDRDFVDHSSDTLRNAHVRKAIYTLAEDLGIKVIIKGNETADETGLMESEGVSRFQGFYFGRPMPVQEFEKLDV